MRTICEKLFVRWRGAWKEFERGCLGWRLDEGSVEAMKGPQSERTVGKPVWVLVFALDDIITHYFFTAVVEWQTGSDERVEDDAEQRYIDICACVLVRSQA